MLGEVRQSWRALLRSPRFTIPVIVILALGIGATSAVFSVVDSILLRPLPYRDPARVMVVLESSTRRGGDSPMPGGDFEDFRSRNSTFESISAAESWSPTLTGLNRAEQLKGIRAFSNLFQMLGVSPALGRGFAASDEKPGAMPVVVLAYPLWQRRFGGDPSVVGRTIRLNGAPATIIGVLPEHFYFPPFWATRAEIYTTPAYGPDRKTDRVIGSLRGFGRLKRDVEIERARADLQAISYQMAVEHPRTNEGRIASLTPIQEKTVGRIRTPLIVLLAAVVFTLLIACVNVANMLLARAVTRRKEMAIRESLGAGRSRILRRLIIESVLLSTAASLLGFAFAAWVVPAALAAIPDSGVFPMPRQQDIGIHPGVALFNIAVCIATALLFGVAPGYAAGRADLHRDLRESARGASPSRGAGRLRAVLVGAEVALALVLLSGAGLLIRTFQNLRSIDPGFEPSNVLAVNLAMGASGHAAPARRAAFYREALERMRLLPGVRYASAVNHVPLAGDIFRLHFTVEGAPIPAPADVPGAVYRVAMPGYFQTMGMTLRAGRDFAVGDREDAPRVAIVNSSMAARFWPGASAVGKRFRIGDPQATGPWITIVGVLNDVKQWEWDKAVDSEFYVPFWQDPTYLHDPGSFATMTLVVKAAGAATPLASAIQRQIWAVDGGVAVPSILPMERVIADAVWTPRVSMMLMSAFAFVAALLAALGIVGVVSYVVAARSREIGIRMALGATPPSIVRMVLRQAMQPVLTGAAVGLAAAVGLTRLLASLLYGVKPEDPVILLGMTAITIVLASSAALVPARRAAILDATLVLRAE